MGLLTYLREVKGYDHVSYERVCSGGLGIPNLYAYLKDTGYAPEPAWLAERLASSPDPTPVIITTAQDQKNPCDLCIVALDLFVDIMASESGNLALKVLATGGIYLGGGIPPRILPKLDHLILHEQDHLLPRETGSQLGRDDVERQIVAHVDDSRHPRQGNRDRRTLVAQPYGRRGLGHRREHGHQILNRRYRRRANADDHVTSGDSSV